jgi:hypothetical protein
VRGGGGLGTGNLELGNTLALSSFTCPCPAAPLHTNFIDFFNGLTIIAFTFSNQTAVMPVGWLMLTRHLPMQLPLAAPPSTHTPLAPPSPHYHPPTYSSRFDVIWPVQNPAPLHP